MPASPPTIDSATMTAWAMIEQAKGYLTNADTLLGFGERAAAVRELLQAAAHATVVANHLEPAEIQEALHGR